jgi:hypothetical protein
LQLGFQHPNIGEYVAEGTLLAYVWDTQSDDNEKSESKRKSFKTRVILNHSKRRLGTRLFGSLMRDTTRQESDNGIVGQRDETEIVGDGDDGRKIDRNSPETTSATYADIVRKGRDVLNKISGLKVRGARTPLTFRN